MKTLSVISRHLHIPRNVVLEVIVLLLLILFLCTAVSKGLNQETFRDGLDQSPFLTSYTGVLIWGVPLVEIGTVLLLLFNQTLMFGLYSVVFLMSAFTAYIYLLLHYSYYVPCLCHAALESLTWEQHLWFNLIFLVLAITGVLLEAYRNEKRGDRTALSNYNP